MKKINILITLILATTLFTIQQCSKSQETYSAAAVDSCLAPASWFPHNQTPSPNEGANSPFADPNTTSNCDFHLWSWQKFLFLTRTAANGKLNFENMVQVDNQMNKLAGDVLILDDDSQAGTHSVLLDKTNQPIYYAIFIDSMMFGFANQYTELFITKCRNGNDLDPVKLKAFGYDTLTYPVGSFEVKTSWILASSLPPGNANNYYVTNAMMKNKMTEVALIGMHIVGRVINHPEFIWSTFDHADLAPTVKWPANTLVDSIPDMKQILSASNLLFYNANTPMDSSNITKKAGSTLPFKSIYHLFDHGNQLPYGGILPHLKAQDSTNISNINMINNSVLARLNTESGPWKNYYYYGSIWIDPITSTLQPGDGSIGALTAANLRGSRALSNVTMETYGQYNNKPIPMPISSSNCFACHGTVNFNLSKGGDYNLALSHLFNNSLNDKLGLGKNPPNINPKYKLDFLE